jgi:MYXO-CTERM domain-containing protein
MKRSDRRPALAAALAFAALSLAPAAASAYCRTANCPTQKTAWQVCTPTEADDCGTKVWWANRCIGFNLQKDASSQVTLSQAENVFTTAFQTWMNADCGGGKHPSVTVTYEGPVDCHTQEYNKDKGNANIIMFDDNAWPYAGTNAILALTTVTYNLDTSEIYDADLEVNSHGIKDLTLGDSGVKYDMLSIAQHETGHFLGLAHSHTAAATMYPEYKEGSVALRTLDPDDVAAICDTYPPDKPASMDCNDEPRHGFSSVCAAEQPDPKKGGCTVSGAAGEGGPAPAGLAGALGLAALASLRRRRRRAGIKEAVKLS